MILPKPAVFSPEGLPPFTENWFVPFWADRALQVPVVQKVHTNAASGIATNQSSYNWATSKPGVNTCPHYQVQLDGKAAKYLPTNRRGLGNATVTSSSDRWDDLTQAQRDTITAHGQIRNWSLVMETSDLGYGEGKPGDASGFTDAQILTIAGILAYDSIVWNIPLAPNPVGYWLPATDTHTWPHDYPYTTIYPGKTCPGWKKKEQMVSDVLPLANRIRSEWLGTTPPPVGDDDMTNEQFDTMMNMLGTISGQLSTIFDMSLNPKLDAINASVNALDQNNNSHWDRHHAQSGE